MLALNRAEPDAAAEAALPRGMRRPIPGPDAGEVGDFAGKDMDAERKFEVDLGESMRLDVDGTGDVRRDPDESYTDVGREDVDVARLRSMVVAMSLRVSVDGASSSSLGTMI